jgi:hypothetical protein
MMLMCRALKRIGCSGVVVDVLVGVASLVAGVNTGQRVTSARHAATCGTIETRVTRVVDVGAVVIDDDDDALVDSDVDVDDIVDAAIDTDAPRRSASSPMLTTRSGSACAGGYAIDAHHDHMNMRNITHQLLRHAERRRHCEHIPHDARRCGVSRAQARMH